MAERLNNELTDSANDSQLGFEQQQQKNKTAERREGREAGGRFAALQESLQEALGTPPLLAPPSSSARLEPGYATLMPAIRRQEKEPCNEAAAVLVHLPWILAR